MGGRGVPLEMEGAEGLARHPHTSKPPSARRPLPAPPPPQTLTLALIGGMASSSALARRLWLRTEHVARLAHYTPFVVCLAAGTLELEVFRQYVAQDLHFLRAFCRAYELAEQFADGDEDKAAIFELRKAVGEELKMHNSVLEEWGIDPTKEIVPNPATVKYTKFLLATAEGNIEGLTGFGKIVSPFEKTKIAAYTVGAMTPCMRLYASLGKQLQMFLPHDVEGHPYKKWIDTYSSRGFEEAAVQIEELLDKLSVILTFEELEVIERLYQKAVKLEIEFFSVQPVVQQTAVPLIRLHDPVNRLFIFSEFDLTCTVIDSAAILAEIVILKASQKACGIKAINSIPPKADGSETDNSITPKAKGTEADIEADNLTPWKSSSDTEKAWTAISEQYTAEYEHCIESLRPQRVETFSYEDLYNDLGELSIFAKRVNSKIIELGLLSGIKLGEIKKAGEHMILQDGCADFFQKVVNKKNELNAELHIISHCWCDDLIRSSFSSVGCLHDLTIHSNKFNYEDTVSTGEFTRNIESPTEKLEAFKNILNTSSNNAKHLSLYIGNTVGDLLCMLKADVGIVIGSNMSLRTLGKNYGVAFVPLHTALVHKQMHVRTGSPIWNGSSGVLYTVSTWSEIVAFVLGA